MADFSHLTCQNCGERFPVTVAHNLRDCERNFAEAAARVEREKAANAAARKETEYLPFPPV